VAEEGHDRHPRGAFGSFLAQRRDRLDPGQPGGVGVDEDEPGPLADALDELGGAADRADLQVRTSRPGGFPDAAQEQEVVYEGQDSRHQRSSIAIMGRAMTGMKSLTGTRTHENLKLAFAAESQANRRDLHCISRRPGKT
jgi:hypothetical protein